jgi:hypothetical protein
MKANKNFKAVFNVFNYSLAIKYGTYKTYYFFTDLDEWVAFSLNGDDDNPLYLDVHLHYDESLQLIFYPKIEGEMYSKQNDVVAFDSSNMNNIPEQIKIVYSNKEFDLEESKI